MWQLGEEDIDYDAFSRYLRHVECSTTDYGLNSLLDRTKRMLLEVDVIRKDTDTLKQRISEANRWMQWTEKRLEDIRRQHNRSAAILWNFPDDLHPTLVQSASQQEKSDAVANFLTNTVGIPSEVVGLIGIEHIRVFYTIYKSERSANVRLQFADDESKSLCETYCIPFLKTFNQMRPMPTRWKEDQTEMQRDQEKEIRQQKQKQKSPAKGQLLFTKFIRWPPPQQA
jgi:hypothetical protein